MERRDLKAGQGETFDLNLEYQADDGTPIDLSGHTATFYLKERLSGTVLETHPGAVDAEGNIDFKVPDETTASWPSGKSAYLVELTFPGGDERWLMYGAIDVVTGVDL